MNKIIKLIMPLLAVFTSSCSLPDECIQCEEKQCKEERCDSEEKTECCECYQKQTYNISLLNFKTYLNIGPKHIGNDGTYEFLL